MIRFPFLLFFFTVLAITLTPADSRDVFPYPYLPIRYLAATSQFVPGPPLPPPRPPPNHYPSGPSFPPDGGSRALFSCRRRCGLKPNPEWGCQCHAECQELDNCCHDFEQLCFTCTGRCKKFIKHALCQCNTKCKQFNNCCSDYEQKCSKIKARHGALVSTSWFGALKTLTDDYSCAGRCNTHDTSKPCQCNSPCVDFGDCCEDYEELCSNLPSCSGKCDVGYDPAEPCQCNDQCDQYENCCPDYYDVCNQLPGGVTDAVLAELSEELLAMDNDNNIASFVSANIQGLSPRDGSDVAPLPLLTVDPAAYNKPTVAKLIKLHDNYVPAVGTTEDVTPEEEEETNEFLDLLMATPIMTRTGQFLVERGFISGDFRETFQKIWFGQYSRASGSVGSSGFEHVFLGELKNGVSGFHHWAYWAREETNGNLNYKGYVNQQSIGAKGMVLSESFDWRDEYKPVSSMFIGPSPELEMALYTVCWYARPNTFCPLVLNGAAVQVQTYDITYEGEKYVASSYAT